MTASRSEPPGVAAPEPWQLLPELSPDEYAALKADVALRGVLVPVVIDADTGAVLDGHHRIRAFEELRAEGVKMPDYPRQVVRFGDDEERAGFVLAANLFRRHLTRSQRAELVARLRSEGWSLRRIAEVVGTSEATVRREIASTDAIDLPERVERKGGGTYPAKRPVTPPRIFVSGRRDEARARAALAALPEGASSPSNLLRAEERARVAALAKRRAGEVPPRSTGRAWEVRSGDFREVLADVAGGSVDAIVTDPPYDASGVALFGDLGAFAARVLKPGRLLACYVGKIALDEEIAALAEHLEWCWCGAVFLPGRHVQIRSRMIRSSWRPVLMFSKGRYEPRSWLLDTTTSEGRGEKGVEDHHWQQTTGPFIRFVEQITRPGELVVDPFAGGGTTGLACLSTGRRFLGADLDPGAVSLTVERLSQAEADRASRGAPSDDGAAS